VFLLKMRSPDKSKKNFKLSKKILVCGKVYVKDNFLMKKTKYWEANKNAKMFLLREEL